MNSTITKTLQLPFQFEVLQLQRDLQAALNEQWTAHFNTSNYDGEWNVIALYAPNGNASNILALNIDQAPLEPTPILTKCPYFQEVINHFKCPLLSVRLLKLKVGAYIKPHKDNALGYEDNCFRLHIPIVTNPDVEFILDGERLNMQEGECWYTNVNFTHSVANRGNIDRVHLIIDGERNAWSDQLFFSLAPKESFTLPPPSHSKETIERMIAELSNNDSPAAEALIAQLQAQLQQH